jgi:hypothetical protein
VILLGELGEPVVLLLVPVPDLAEGGGVPAPVSRGVQPHQQVHHPLPEEAFLPKHRDRRTAFPQESPVEFLEFLNFWGLKILAGTKKYYRTMFSNQYNLCQCYGSVGLDAIPDSLIKVNLIILASLK